jgi:acyl carrier protein
MSSVTGSVDEVRNWILRKHPERESIDADLDLIENRLIDSLSFVEFVFAIESASGVSIDVEDIDVDDFRTLASIEKAFFRNGGESAT